MPTDFKANVIAELAKIVAKDDTLTTSAEPFANQLFAGACVRATYKVSELMTKDVTSDALEELLAASRKIHTKQSVIPSWELEDETRRKWLQNLANKDLLRSNVAQVRVGSDNPLQRMLTGYITGSVPTLDKQNLEELAATSRVESWLRGIVANLPTAEDIAAAREIRELLAPFENLVRSFRGRAQELAQLNDYVEWLPPATLRSTLVQQFRRLFDLHEKPPLVISGLGGAGKSTLIAKFIIDHWSDPKGRIPFAYLDFDRPAISLREPLTLLIEAARQLALQYPKAAPSFNRLIESWKFDLAATSKSRSSRRQEARPTSSTAGEKRIFTEEFAAVWLNALEDEDRPLLMVFDSFEEVQGRIGELYGVFELLVEWSRYIPRLRVVIAGRSEIKAFPAEHVHLGDFDEESALGFLSSQGIEEPLARILFERVRGNPLTLQLAVSAVRQFGDQLDDFRSRSWFFVRFDSERIQQELFRRNLSHIKNSRVKALAFPGLVVRRLSPEVIQYVLAEPCGLGLITATEAAQLFSEMQMEVFLVSTDVDGQLRFRPDLRRLLLQLILTEEPTLAKRIHDNAVSYYQRRNDPASKAEVVYHRLARGDEVQSVAELLEPDLLSHLAGSLSELSPGAHIFLANHYRLPVPEAIRKDADLVEWEKAMANLIRKAFESGSMTALKACSLQLEQRSDRSPSQELSLVEAELLERLDRVDEALATAEVAIGLARQQKDANAEYEMHLLCVWILERSGQWSKARRMLKRAHKLARQNNMFEQALDTALELFVGARRIRPYPARRAMKTAVLVEADLKRWRDNQSIETDSLSALRPELRAKVEEVLRELSLSGSSYSDLNQRWLSEEALHDAQIKLAQQARDVADLEQLVYMRLGVQMRTFSELTGTVELAAFEAIRYAEWRNCVPKLLDSNETSQSPRRSRRLETATAYHPRAWILVAGSGNRSGLSSEVIYSSEAIGKMLAREGYGLVTGGWPGVDYLTASSFAEAVQKFDRHLEDFLLQVVPARGEPDFKGGRVLPVSDDIGVAIEKADAVVLISGAGGTRLIGERAITRGKPVFPVPGTGGDARQVFDSISKDWSLNPTSSPNNFQNIVFREFSSLDSSLDLSIHALSQLLANVGVASSAQKGDAR
jgi:hypothetical protein